MQQDDARRIAGNPVLDNLERARLALRPLKTGVVCMHPELAVHLYS
jgi:hypothetical protein